MEAAGNARCATTLNNTGEDLPGWKKTQDKQAYFFYADNQICRGNSTQGRRKKAVEQTADRTAERVFEFARHKKRCVHQSEERVGLALALEDLLR